MQDEVQVPRRGLLVGVVLLLALACLHIPTAHGDAAKSYISWQTHSWNGLERVYGVYVPDSVQNPAPLVFILHGGGGSAAKTWNQEHGLSWKALADEDGIVLVLPEGQSDPGDAEAHHWNDCRTDLDPTLIATTEDDVGFIIDLITEVSEIAAIDQDRVYATGASNGGMMTYRLAIEAADQFAAAAAIIANLPDPSECSQPLSSIPMLIMNGTKDTLMPYDGGCVANDRCQRGRVLSTIDTIAFWVDANGAMSDPVVETLPNLAWFDGSTVTVYRFNGGPNGADVVYYHVKGGGHNVPGFEANALIARALAGSKNRDIDGPTEVWAFFQQY